MPNSPWSRSDRRRQLLAAWERRCRAKGEADHCSGADALFLVTTLTNAVRQATATSELGRAARTWGARFTAPVQALAALTHLRDALVDVGEDLTEHPVVPVAVLNRVFDQVMMEAVDAASTNLRSVALKDPLTGCANRRALDEELGHAVASARRSGLDLTVAIVDLDGLKAINDNHGHAAGDAALVSLVGVLRSVLREADTLYRTGGDEFVVVAPFTEAAGARALMRRAERIGGPSFSWGIASLGHLPTNVAADMVAPALLATADGDLYRRRRTRRLTQRRADRRRRAATVASVAASAAVVASGAGLAAALTVGSVPKSGPATGTTLAAPRALPLIPDNLTSPGFHPPGGAAAQGSPGPTAPPVSPPATSEPPRAPGLAAASGAPSTVVSAAGPPLVTALSLSASDRPAVVGEEVHYVAQVVPAGTGGSVGFLDDGTAIPGCGAVPMTSGQAVCSVQYQTTGSHAISAVFTPASTGVLGSQSTPLTETVDASSSGNGQGGGGSSGPAGGGSDDNDGDCDEQQSPGPPDTNRRGQGAAATRPGQSHLRGGPDDAGVSGAC